MTAPDHPRRIRSFVRREGRMTAAQQRALETLMPVYGLSSDSGPVDLDAAFGRSAPRILEIGFGSGTSLLEMAQAHPEIDYIGIEVHRPGVGSLLLRLEQEGIHNVRVICADAVEVLENAVADDCLDGIHLFFPDPWHKKKHHKRRIVRPAFAELIRRRLKPGGYVHMATDWANYAEHMLDVMSNASGFRNAAGDGYLTDRRERPETKYERRGQRLGHEVWDLMFVKS
jgi:tRNA (guanine-N7-)-methyltransferase